MARLYTSGAELNDATGEQITLNGATFSSVNPRSGALAFRQTTSNGSVVTISTVTGRTYFARAYIFVSALPAADTRILQLGASGALTSLGRVWLKSDGTLILTRASTNVQIGSASAAVSAGSWFRVELAERINVGTTDTLEARLNGVSFASGSGLDLADTALNQLVFASTNGDITMDVDDVALNDDQGASQNSWPDSGKVVLLVPISLNTNGGSWTDDAAATTSAALTNALDNTPPNGIADTTSGGGNHQVRNAAANTSLDMNLTTYATAGIAAADTINVITPMCNVGAPVSTQAKSGSFGVSANPVIANRAFTGGSGTATFFWRGAAPGTYPTNWATGWERGTVTYGSSVTVGSSPVARLTITGGTTSRIAMCDFMGLYVDYTPSTARVPRASAVNHQNPGII